MAQFVHLAPESARRAILRGGLRGYRVAQEYRGVFAHPQTENFVLSHQWMRELRRFHGTRQIAVRFRIPDTESVWIGRYNEEHIGVSAAEAIGIARHHIDPLGLEVVVPRPVRANEIESIFAPPKVIGWRFHPGAKGTKPCGCAYCQRGEPYSARIRLRYGTRDA